LGEIKTLTPKVIQKVTNSKKIAAEVYSVEVEIEK
jgi:hypothetical protein